MVSRTSSQDFATSGRCVLLCFMCYHARKSPLVAVFSQNSHRCYAMRSVLFACAAIVAREPAYDGYGRCCSNIDCSECNRRIVALLGYAHINCYCRLACFSSSLCWPQQWPPNPGRFLRRFPDYNPRIGLYSLKFHCSFAQNFFRVLP